MAHAHNHSLLALDELKELPPDQAGRVGYQLANGQGRQAMDRNRAIRIRQTWNLIFLSNGEFDFISHIRTAEKRAYAGQEVRVTTIPVDRGELGAFDFIHSAASASEFAKMLSKSADDYYGTAARAFIARVNEVGHSEITAELDRKMSMFVAHNRPVNAGAEVGRVLDRFALIAAAGELATEWKITAWGPGEASAAVSDLFRSCLTHRGTVGSFDQREALQHVRDYFLQFGPSRFQRHHAGKPIDAEAKIQNRIGFINQGPDGLEYQFVDHIPREFCGQYSQEIILQALDSIGAMVKEGGRQKVERVVPGYGSLRCYVVNHRLLFSDSDD